MKAKRVQDAKAIFVKALRHNSNKIASLLKEKIEEQDAAPEFENIYLAYNSLKSLVGVFPKNYSVSGFFDCSHTKIVSLEGAPKVVGMNFYCSNTDITS